MASLLPALRNHDHVLGSEAVGVLSVLVDPAQCPLILKALVGAWSALLTPCTLLSLWYGTGHRLSHSVPNRRSHRSHKMEAS